MHIYSKNAAVPVIFVVHWSQVLGLYFVEHTHISDTGYAATRSTFIFADTNSDTGFITTEQLISYSPSISRTTLTTVSTWDNVEIPAFSCREPITCSYKAYSFLFVLYKYWRIPVRDILGG